jgi:very-short-patch-repair endonuclease
VPKLGGGRVSQILRWFWLRPAVAPRPEVPMEIAKSCSAQPLLGARARIMRFSPTPSEERLFAAIGARKLGVRFHRQVPLGRYVADFVAPAVRLVLEVDGGYHAGRRRADARRDEWLRRAGYRVLRVEADLVLHDLPAVVARIRAELGERG